MAPVTIRPMAEGDYPVFDRFEAALHEMHRQARPDLFVPCEHPASEEEFRKMLDNPLCVKLLAEQGGRPLGMLVAYLREPDGSPIQRPMKTAYISDLYVAEEARRMGAGKALYQAAQSRAKAWGAEFWGLTAWPFNEAALKFYESLGFTVQSYTLGAKL